MAKNVDMTIGNIQKQLVVFAIPIFLGTLFQNLYNSVDSLVVGNFLGKEALAALNTCAPISRVLIGFFVGMSTGASVVFSRCFGSRNYSKLRTSLHTTVLFSFIVGGVMAAIGIIFSDFLLGVVGCPEDIFTMADGYLKVYVVGVFFTAIYNVGSGILRAIGDSRHPFYALLTASILNIILDILFVHNFNMGVVGAAVATVISQAISVIIVFVYMQKMDERYRFHWNELGIDREILSEVVELGLPSGIQSSLISVSNMFVHRYINAFGSTATAGVGVAERIDAFAAMPVQSIGLAMTTFVSQNVGAQKKDRVASAIKSGIVMSMIAVIALGLPIYFKSDFLASLFNRDAGVISYAQAMMKTLVPLYIVMALDQTMAGTLRGYGFTRQVMYISFVGIVVARQVWLYFSMKIHPDVMNVYIGFPMGWIINSICMVAYYLYAKRNGKIEKVYLEQAARK